MTVFGLTGGIASGKSFAARLLAERGAVVLDADRLAHGVLAETDVLRRLAARWGDAVIGPDGSLVRSEVARRVFGEGPAATAQRRFLEGIVHPRVRERLTQGLADARATGAPAAVLDVPLLIEANWLDACDAVLFVDTPDAVRRERAARRGWSPEELARREATQTPIEEKRRAADAVIPGDDEPAARRGIDAAWCRWVERTETDSDESGRG